MVGRFKVIGQILVGLIARLTLFFNQEVVVRKVYHQNAPAPNADWVSTSKKKKSANRQWRCASG